MLFNSFQFAVFFVIVYGLYLVLNHKWQNRMLLAASYTFYGAWDWRFLGLLIFSNVFDYVIGQKIRASSSPHQRKVLLGIGVAIDLGILGFFKYFDFFAESAVDFLGLFGLALHPVLLNVILPIGISFYTFQGVSYLIDVYRGDVDPPKSLLDFSLFVCFFPQLVAGPIERASRLLPQMIRPRKITRQQVYDGVYLILWGLFQKVVIADNLAKIVDPVFQAPPPYDGALVLIAVYAFAFQIFCDFQGYSNMARGLAKLMGFELMVNFNLPYFATNPSDFWHRWHISLSTWLRDYLYIPLGGNRKGELMTYRNLALTMLLGGLWHGASWTFVLWGAYQGMLLIVYKMMQPLLKRIPEPKTGWGGRLWLTARIAFFFQCVCVGWLFFRAQSLEQVGWMLQSVFMNFEPGAEFWRSVAYFVYFVGLLVTLQVFKYRSGDGMIVMKWSPVWKTVVVLIAISMVLYIEILAKSANIGGGSEFIYFQF